MRFSSIQAHWILAFLCRPLVMHVKMLDIQNHRWLSCPLKGLESREGDRNYLEMH